MIQLTAKGKDMLMDTVIDNTGILQAKGLSAKMVLFILMAVVRGLSARWGPSMLTISRGVEDVRLLKGNVFI
ncbi:hypothetical protein A8P48_05055 [Yersinia pestis]|nr:hypothetical protein AU254_13685 [Yersinia pestis]PCN66817.1 hypothetical protein A8P48_05055 [Yersinia pestis]